MNIISKLFIIPICVLSIISCEKTQKKEFSYEVEYISSPTKSSLRGMSVYNQNVIWISGSKGAIIKSEDGGKNWAIVSPPNNDSLDYRSIQLISKQDVVIASAGFPARIYKSNNSGKEWNLVYENLDSAAFINSILIKENGEGVAFGDVINNRHLILFTNNFGNNWEEIPSKQLPKPLGMENGFAASGSCITTDKDGNFTIILGGSKVRAFSSKDGKNWKVTETSMLAGGPSKGAYSIASGNSKLIAVGGDYLLPDSCHFGTVKTTSDKWKKTNSKLYGYRSVIDYSEDLKIWLSGGTNGMDFSSDDALNWKHFSDIGINTFRFIEATNYGIAATNKGQLLKITFN